MSEIAAATSGETRWIRCPGCSGQIGAPPAWPSETVCCPKCAAVVHIDERMRVLWRPAGQQAADASANERADWLACHGCKGEIGIPTDWLGPTIACPKCGAIVAMRETPRVLWRPPEAEKTPEQVAARPTAPTASKPAEAGWKRTAAIVLLTLGGLAFFSSAVIGGRGDAGVGLVAGLLNPLFFIGVPLGWYWLRSAKHEPQRKNAPMRPDVASFVSPAPTPAVLPSAQRPLAVAPALASNSSKPENIDEWTARYLGHGQARTAKSSKPESNDGATAAVWAVVVISLVLFAGFVGFIISETQRGDSSSLDQQEMDNEPSQPRTPRPQSDALAPSTIGDRGDGLVRTSVYGVEAEGRSFVYIFDRSDSMGVRGGSPLASAKAQLIASLDDLTYQNEFHIIFYNTAPHMIDLGRGFVGLASADEWAKGEAKKHIRAITASGGTDHFLALRAGLELHPDVIFFLTDADQPGLTRPQLDHINRLNNGRTSINTIEFGDHPHSSRENFLGRVARENGGRYVYIGTTKIEGGMTALPSGLQYKVLKNGKGKSPKPHDTVKFHYEGTLVDGTKFDSSYDRGEEVLSKVVFG